MTDLGTLGGNNSEAIWINDGGDVVCSVRRLDLAYSVYAVLIVRSR